MNTKLIMATLLFPVLALAGGGGGLRPSSLVVTDMGDLFQTEYSSEDSYQIKNISGKWKAQDSPYINDDLFIAVSPDKKSVLLLECEPFDLETTGNCIRRYQYAAVGTYSDSADLLQMSEGPGSPNPKFILKVDSTDPNMMYRSWENHVIKYFKIQEKRKLSPQIQI